MLLGSRPACWAMAGLACWLVASCGGGGTPGITDTTRSLAPGGPGARRPGALPRTTLDVYAADRPGALSPVARQAAPRVYVPNSETGTVDVIDQRSLRVVSHLAVGKLPQHVVPAWDLRRLYVTNDLGNSLTPIDPRTGRSGATIPVRDPYNLYFTPDGRFGIVVAEALHHLDFYDPQHWRMSHALSVPCRGVDHLDFSANGRIALASCEFSSQLVAIDVARQRVITTVALPAGAMPQDVKLAPDGSRFFVADQARGGVYAVAAHTLRLSGFVPTGAGAHGLYVSRSSQTLYVTNRAAGTVSLLDPRTARVRRTWSIPGSSPDMGGLSSDGRTLWLSGRYNSEVYALDTRTGRLRARIPVGAGPHGLCVWPQPGRYSLGHTGILR